MKRKILSVLGVLMAVLMSTAALSACNKIPAGADSSGGSGESVSTEQGGEPSVSESGAESGESGAQNESFEQSDIPFITFEKEKELWSSYSENYTLYSCDWANERYFAIVLKSKSDDSYKIVFWDTENSAIVVVKDPDEEERQHFYSLDTGFAFCRDNAYFILADSGRFFRISFDTFECSLVDGVKKIYPQEKVRDVIFFSPNGITAELVDENSILIYDALAPDKAKLIKTNDIAKEGIQLNQGISWSRTGEYFVFVNHHYSDDIFEDGECSVFDKNGAFIRYIYGSNMQWDYDSVWASHVYTTAHKGPEVWSIYSITDPQKEPIEVEDIFSLRGSVDPRNGIYYADIPNEDRTARTVIMVDTNSGVVKPCFRYGMNVFGFGQCSPDGKFYAKYRCNYPRDYLAFAFINFEDYNT